ncbi:hypothetical protein L5C00_10325 [Pseudomonas aeruginosa]|nr:hypothetical protein [Pseudomonas aeruginosa]MDG4145880.1 hypothetical protein [Pseudomonas aeruginosa]
MNKALDLLRGLVSEVERKTCEHEETHRGGAIWEICDSCGAKWADDEGGKPEFAWPESVEKARAFLATHPAVEQAGGDERVIGWRERILAAHPNSDPGFWPDALLVEHMAAEIADLRAALAQPSPAQAEQHWPKLEKPAQVGAIRFSAGVSSRLVVEAAQRLYEFESTPEKEAERIERLQAFREQCFEPLGTEFSKVLSENLVELSSDAKPEQAEAERPEIVATLFTPNEKVHNVIGFKAFAVAGDCDKEGGEFYDPEKLMTVAQHARIVGALRAKADQLREALEWRAENQAGQRELLRSVKAERDAALAEVAGLRSLLNSLLCYVERDIDRMRSDRDKSDNKEIYDRSISLAMERLKAAQNAVFTTEPGCDTAVELAAQTTQAQHSVPGKYDDVLLPFLKSMEHELHANAGKGDRPGWLQMDRRTALLEIYYHLAKLQKATKDNDAAGIVEYAADVANMSMMLVDVCGLLAAAPGKEGV